MRPALLGAMAGCLAYSLNEFVRLFAPAWQGSGLLFICVVAILLGYYSYHLTHARIPSEQERQRFYLLALLAAFVLLKLGEYLDWPIAAILADVRSWFSDPLRFFSVELIVTFCIFTVIWFIGLHTAADFDRIGVATLDRQEPPPLQTLSGRFYFGGVLLMFLFGMTRLTFAAVLELERPPVPGLILNVLLYYLLGTALLGQTRLTTLFKQWEAQRIPVASDLPARWLRYSAAFLLLALLLAFILPTAYTIPLLVWANWLLWLILMFANTLFFLFRLLLYPLVWLLSLLMGNVTEAPRLPAAPPPPEMGEAVASGGLPWWADLLKSLAFWGVLLGMMLYMLSSYLREHPALLQVVGDFAPFRAAARLWQAFWGWLRGAARIVRAQLPRLAARRARAGNKPSLFSALRRNPRSPREVVLRRYLETLERAAAHGFPRRAPQTPAEYRQTLAPQAPEIQPEIAALTASFEEARYSQHTIGPEAMARASADSARIQAALERRAAAEQTEEEQLPGNLELFYTRNNHV